MSIEELVAQLIEAGTPPTLAASIVARAYVEGVNAVERAADVKKSPAAIRQARYRDRKASQTVTNHNIVTHDVTDRNDVDPLSPSPSFFPPDPLTNNPLPLSPSSLRSATKPVRGDEFFVRFWAVYPRKAARKSAESKFLAAVKSGVDPERIISGAQRYAVSGLDPKYTKHPTTWLNGGCWDDEPMARAGPERSSIARMAMGDFGDEQNEQQFGDIFSASPSTRDANEGDGGFAGRLPERLGGNPGGRVLDLRQEDADWR